MNQPPRYKSQRLTLSLSAQLRLHTSLEISEVLWPRLHCRFDSLDAKNPRLCEAVQQEKLQALKQDS